MKKVFAILAVAAAICSVSCQKNNSGKSGGKTPSGGGGEYVQPITIDGQFEDWAALDASKVATAKCATGAHWTALKTVKVYADPTFVFVYIEWDKEQIKYYNNPDDPEDAEWVPFHVYINNDNDAATGGFSDQFADACIDVLFEGFLTDGDKFASYDPGAYLWVGEAGGSGWGWTESAVVEAGSGIASGAGVEGKYEIAIVRELIPNGLTDTFSIGFDIQQGWDSVGVLPNAEATEDNGAGVANSLTVVTVK